MSGRALQLGFAAMACWALSAAGSAFADAGNSDAGNSDVRLLAATCAACHGTDGHAAAGSIVAGLAGMPKADFVRRMRAFRAGTRDGEDPRDRGDSRDATVMPQIAKGFDDAQLDALGDYFAAARH